MVVDSIICAPGRACSRTTSFTRLRAQITTSASPMSLAPRMVSRSGAPGPAPINHTLPKLPPLLLEVYRREVRRLPAHHLGGLRSEEHTSELQLRQYLVCRLLLV